MTGNAWWGPGYSGSGRKLRQRLREMEDRGRQMDGEYRRLFPEVRPRGARERVGVIVERVRSRLFK